MPSRAAELMHSLSGDAQTIIRSPHSTVTPPRANAHSGEQVLQAAVESGLAAPALSEPSA